MESRSLYNVFKTVALMTDLIGLSFFIFDSVFLR